MHETHTNKSLNFYTNIFRQLHGLIVVMDKNSRFLLSNDYTAKVFGYINEESMLGTDVYDLNCPAVVCAPDFYYQNQTVAQTGSELTVLDIHTFAYGEPKILLTKKTPYRENSEITGVIYHAMEIHSSALSQICAALIKSDKKYHSNSRNIERSYTIGPKTNKKQLTERELDCVFYLMRGNTRKQIAQLLNISHRTVESHLEQIRIKLKCSYRSGIIDYCLAEGLLNYIPRSFFVKNVSNIIHKTESDLL